MFLNVQVTFMMAEGVNDVERFFVRPDDLRLAIGHPNISGMDIHVGASSEAEVLGVVLCVGRIHADAHPHAIG